jgi:hypothetical protein
MDSFLSNIFPWMGHQQKVARAAALAATTLEVETQHASFIVPLSIHVDASIPMDLSDGIVDPLLSSPEMSRKRSRRLRTPTLISSNANSVDSAPSAFITPCHSDVDDDSTLIRPNKIFRGTTHHKLRVISSDETIAKVGVHEKQVQEELSKTKPSTVSLNDSEEDAKRAKTLSETPLDLLPEDILALTLSFVSDTSNRFALQCTSKQFHGITSTPAMMNKVNVGGDPETGVHGIILETDTKDTAIERLSPFAASGNVEALYMYVKSNWFFRLLKSSYLIFDALILTSTFFST